MRRDYKPLLVVSFILCILALLRLRFDAISLNHSFAEPYRQYHTKTIKPLIDSKQYCANHGELDVMTRFVARNTSAWPKFPPSDIVQRHDNSTSDDPFDSGFCAWDYCENIHCQHFPHAMQYLYRCFSYWNNVPRTTSKAFYSPYVRNYRFYWHNKEQGFSKFWPHLRLKPFPYNSVVIRRMQRHFRLDIRGVLPLAVPSENEGVQPKLSGMPAFAVIDPVADSRAFANAMLYEKHQQENLVLPLQCHAPRLRILNRRNSRSIMNVDDVANVLSSALNTTISIHYFEQASPMEQLEFMSSTDILISPHGAQLTSLIVMPECASVFEVFPHGYYLVDFFGSLADSAAVRHYSAIVPENGGAPMVAHPRDYNFCFDPDSFLPVVQTIINDWTACCRSLSLSTKSR